MGRTISKSVVNWVRAQVHALATLARILASTIAGVAFLTATAAAADEAGPLSDCKALGRKPLTVELDPENNALHQVSLTAGDALRIRFESGAIGPFGTLTLREGAGAPRSLLVGPTGTSVTFAPAASGSFRFEMSKEGPEPAAFSLSCVAARDRERSGLSPEAKRRGTRLPAGALDVVEPYFADDPTALMLDAAVPLGSNGPPGLLEHQPKQLVVAVLPPSDLDVNLQWRGERDGAAVFAGRIMDSAATGVDAALKYKPLPDIMIGALAQLEKPDGTVIGGPVALSEHGWMAGPVAALKLAPGLSLDARAAWGVAETAADPFAARTLSTPRREVSARVTNTQTLGAWRVRPSISVHHLEETAATPGAEPHDAATSHTLRSGRVEIGPEIAYRIDLENSVFVEPRAGLGSFWDIQSLSQLAPGEAHGDMRLKAEAGVTVGAADGARLQAGAAVEEAADGASDVWSGRLQLKVPIK